MNLDPKTLSDEPEPEAEPLPDVDVTTPSVVVSDEFVDRLYSMTSQQATPELIREILAAQNLANSGCAQGTIRRNEANGAVAVKVCRGGVPMWAVIHPDGGFSFDTEPTLPWQLVSGGN
ncbi:uncharacterized protein RMCC_2419 [Mycolicibacterium canariasense]|uniref:Uncharacterized protein n=1 Tax=Mycolicibacterium canariasense TaxID=228230 RepID=A0A100WCC9_MYCCR|nr:hypothetical protein [Mycolicibacterium canariasense]MCV7212674.1 hypothetical protein [Mycolicibacterium canariasense]GAS95453.1 uncharacterized protein RMCC_2419 [Mycolicibacterium canariasense]